VSIDLVAAAQESLLAHLATVELGGSPVRTQRGWPEWNQDLDLGDGPVLSTEVPADVQRTPLYPRPLGSTEEEDGTLTTLYRVELVEFTVQLDAWAPYKATLDDLAVLVEAALQNRLPHNTGCWLASEGYHDRPLTFELLRSRRPDGDDAAPRSEWRLTWLLRCRTDGVATASHPKVAEIVGRLNDEDRPL
jgi:hypothetical protein